MFPKIIGRWAAAFVVAGLCGPAGIADVNSRPVRVHEIQGSGVASPLLGQTLTVRGVVTGFYRGAKSHRDGVYLQETQPDENEATSEGLYVQVASAPAVTAGVNALVLGDLVEVTGKVAELNGLTQLIMEDGDEARVKKTGTAPLPEPVEIKLPVESVIALERYENMRVRFPQTLTVTGNHTLGQFGELYLSSAGVNRQPTNLIDPNDVPPGGTSSSGGSNVAAVTAAQTANARSTILLDDASAKPFPDPTPYLSKTGTRRLGDTVTGVTGVLTYRFNAYRVNPQAPVKFRDVNVRHAQAPKPRGATLTIASANVLNYFITLGDAGRGADNAEELARQKAKIVAMLAALKADVVGLMEIERRADNAALADLVAALNETIGANTYAYVDSFGIAGTDSIQVALIYKKTALTPVGAAMTDVSPRASVHHRPPLAQTFVAKKGGAKFTIVVNHFKSKGGNATGLDANQQDGQAAYNHTRKLQAEALAAFLATPEKTFGDPDVLIMGDLNAYAEEDPIDLLRAAGYLDLLQRYEPDGYSYQFAQQVGYLDHALANGTLASQVTGGAHWHINADEPAFLDYNTENKSAAQKKLNVGTPYCGSDHDPVIIGLRLK